jgi:hypothetical protein
LRTNLVLEVVDIVIAEKDRVQGGFCVEMAYEVRARVVLKHRATVGVKIIRARRKLESVVVIDVRNSAAVFRGRILFRR